MDYVLYEMSFQNMLLYSSVVPTYKNDAKEGDKKQQEHIKADDPKNKKRVHDIIESLV